MIMSMLSLSTSSSSSSPSPLLFLLLLLALAASVLSPGAHAATKQEYVDDVEKAFLGILGLPARPTPPKGPIHVPQKLKDLYEELNNLEPGTFDKELQLRRQYTSSASVHLPGNTVRTFYFQEDADIGADSRTRKLHFDVGVLPSTETLHRAELHVLREVPVSDNATMRLNVYQVLSNSSSEHEMIVDTKLLHHTARDKWHTLDVTDVVKQWRDTPHANHGIRVEVSGGGSKDRHGARLRRSADIEQEEWLRQQPYLVTYTDDRDVETQQREQDTYSDSKNRRRRRARTRRSKKLKKDRRRRRKRICRRHSLLVDFEEVGWNSWIVAPPSYDAYYCHGECPFALSDNLNTTNHAVVQSLVHSMNPEIVPKPCCVPTELSPFSLLYVNTNGTLVLKAYKDMVVEACGCR